VKSGEKLGDVGQLCAHATPLPATTTTAAIAAAITNLVIRIFMILLISRFLRGGASNLRRKNSSHRTAAFMYSDVDRRREKGKNAPSPAN
jgi:hypothetical protein